MYAKTGSYLSEFGRGFQVLLQAAEGRIVVLEVCARLLAAAAPQIAGHVMRNVVGHEVLRWVIAGAGTAGRGARWEMRCAEPIALSVWRVALYKTTRRDVLFCRPAYLS
jgi:hypothetical protein